MARKKIENTETPYVESSAEDQASIAATVAMFALQENERQLAEIRSERNQRLSASDWTQLANAPVDQVAWAEYRQALRDLPEVVADPTKFEWPKEPE